MMWEHFPDILLVIKKEAIVDKLDRIRELHSPIVPPKGMSLLGSTKGTLYCAECSCDDPYDSVEWPCETRKICDETTN